MKALLTKDSYLLFTMGKFVFFMLLLFAVIPGDQFLFFSAVYSVILGSVTLANIDEQCGWDDLALMLPVDRRDVVLVRYILSWALLAVVLVLSTLSRLIASATGFMEVSWWDFAFSLELNVFIALLSQAFTMVVFCRYGLVKGRIAYVVLIAVVTGVVFSLSTIGSGFSGLFEMIARHFRPIYLPIAGVILSALSVPLSVRGYKKRMGV